MVKVLTRLNIKAKKSTEFNIPCFFVHQEKSGDGTCQ
jgi:hypothetical protein